MTGMRTSLKMLMRYFRTGWAMDLFCVFALEVLRENRMDSAAMDMTRISMTMICFGMHMEERNYEHPYGRPHED